MKCEDLKQGNNALLIQTVKITTTLCVFLVNILYTRHVFENKDPNVNVKPVQNVKFRTLKKQWKERRDRYTWMIWMVQMGTMKGQRVFQT